ncbi:isocitrate dehydrogenase [Sinobaca qinghaiensis]|uniref:Isocitrate dehydrogenase [NADP] n=1 Tax=Sinobaca qinghaiensis TaxID=342944 RepID=A0A419UX81_9BACL|nr:NADP-dependent isocitrate dehydrogenase [Sinobaca qinghaiensis]RKD69736.1 isocitrate dehydrogenase [Sinobaca qinghaiensis]
MKKTPITVARGDGIGPEIMDAVLHILEKAEAAVEPEFIEIGKDAYLEGWSTGVPDSAWESLLRTKVFLKAPITTPQGGGYKSLNVTIRSSLGLYANIRPTLSYAPHVKTNHPDMDLVIIRENEEDLYTGIEYQQTPEVVQSLKIITRPGSERLIRHAFEYAKEHNRSKVTCVTKDNIMKRTDGLFHQVFNEIAEEYKDMETDHWIVDIGLAKIADSPEQFDVVVMPNLYGDIGSDIASQISGSVGLGGSANIGDENAMFEAIHGSAPDIAGQGIANPSGLLHGAIQMLVHINQPETASLIHNAWFKTLEDGVYTGDIAKGSASVSTLEFAEAVVERLGQKPDTFEPMVYETGSRKKANTSTVALNAEERASSVERRLEGTDVFLFENRRSVDQIAEILEKLTGELRLTVITNRGANVYPKGAAEIFTTDHWRCRFMPGADQTASHEGIQELLEKIKEAGLEWIQVENLYSFDGEPGYSEAKK